MTIEEMEEKAKEHAEYAKKNPRYKESLRRGTLSEQWSMAIEVCRRLDHLLDESEFIPREGEKHEWEIKPDRWRGYDQALEKKGRS